MGLFVALLKKIVGTIPVYGPPYISVYGILSPHSLPVAAG
jgi:hypothetical protein